MLRTVALVAASIVLALGCILARADSEYPNRPVRLIAAAAPGGNPDVLARLLSQKLSGGFGKAFVVENVPGAGGVVAAKMVAPRRPTAMCSCSAIPARWRSMWCSIQISLTTPCGISPRSRRW
jgi:tripartite-type tricarboxylate transporter receptor subunit TctC